MKSCYDYAMGVIGKYPKTEKELTIKCYQQWYDSEDVARTLERLKKDNFVNDELFAQSYINSEVIKKWKPLFSITQKLELRGIDKSIITSIVQNTQEDIQGGIYQGIGKEIDQYKKKGVEGFDIIQKLLRKGYRLADIKKVVKDRNQGQEE